MYKRVKKIRRFLPLYIMMIPGLAYLVINNYIPLPGLVLAFKQYNYSLGMWKSPFSGLDNFKFLFISKETGIAIRNTLLYNVVFIILVNVVAIMTAVLLNDIRSKWFRKVSQTLVLIPYLLSMVIVSYMVFALLSMDKGMLNSLIKSAGGKPVQWYMQPKYWPLILTSVNTWKNFGYSTIIYYTTIIGTDPAIYEAAAVDGAGRWQQFLHVTLPSLKLMIITMVMLAVGRIFYSDFGLFYQVPMNSGPIHNATTTIDTYVYNALINLNDIGRSAAA